ncbi:MAG: recombinase family protein [Cyanobacteria bacterium P01_H01_bin.15]
MSKEKLSRKQAGVTRTPRRLGYVRTSTERQSPRRQIDGLSAHCDEVFLEEGVSACADHRPVYEDLTASMNPGDTLVVWDLDRAFRSVLDALTEMRRLSELGIGFEAITEQHDLTTPEGGFNFTLRAALSEWEREKLRKRTKEGLDAARARGVTLGRPRKPTPTIIEDARCRIKHSDIRLDILAEEYGVSKRTLSRGLSSKTPSPDPGQDL